MGKLMVIRVGKNKKIPDRIWTKIDNNRQRWTRVDKDRQQVTHCSYLCIVLGTQTRRVRNPELARRKWEPDTSPGAQGG